MWYAVTFILSCVSLLWKIRRHIAVLPYFCLADGMIIQGDSANLCGAGQIWGGEKARCNSHVHPIGQMSTSFSYKYSFILSEALRS